METERHLELVQEIDTPTLLHDILGFIASLLAFLLLEYQTGLPDRLANEYSLILNECSFTTRNNPF